MFTNISEISKITKTGASQDLITDFTPGEDKIDLSAIDASTKLSGNNAFEWAGTASFKTTTAGELRYQQYDNAGTADDYTMVYGDTDTDTGVEFQLKLTGLLTLSANDFIL